MKYISTKEAEKKWNISERRIRKLLEDNRIEGAFKLGKTWNIPDNVSKPIDKRNTKDNSYYTFNINQELLNQIESLNKELNKRRPLSKEALKTIKDSFNLEMIYNSNGIEGNTLTLRETQIVLEGITIGGKTVKEHLEIINHEQALIFLDELVKDNNPISEWNIKNIHQLILKNIDNDNAGKYRNENVLIMGAKHNPPDYIKVPEQMERLIANYNKWNYHPLIKAALFHGELVKIHPFIDGNGRTARLIMNLILINNGYLPVIIKKEDRLNYYNALDKAHTTNDYTDFINIIIELELEILNKYLEFLVL